MIEDIGGSMTWSLNDLKDTPCLNVMQWGVWGMNMMTESKLIHYSFWSSLNTTTKLLNADEHEWGRGLSIREASSITLATSLRGVVLNCEAWNFSLAINISQSLLCICLPYSLFLSSYAVHVETEWRSSHTLYSQQFSVVQWNLSGQSQRPISFLANFRTLLTTWRCCAYF